MGRKRPAERQSVVRQAMRRACVTTCHREWVQRLRHASTLTSAELCLYPAIAGAQLSVLCVLSFSSPDLRRRDVWIGSGRTELR